jgi:hypothetical protein
VFGFALVDRGPLASRRDWAREMRLPHVHAYAVTTRAAFANDLFAKDNQQPLRVRAGSAFEPTQRPGADVPPAAVDWDSIFGHSDYVFVTKSTPMYREYLDQRCARAGARGDAVLYRQCRTNTSLRR